MNPADLSSKTHHNLAEVVNGSFYRHGHSSYSGAFPPEQAILFATMKGGVYKFRGLTSLGEHTSTCNFCCSEFGREVGGILVFHTELLGKNSTTSSPDSPADYNAILTDANTLLKEHYGQIASLGKGSGEGTYAKQFYLELLSRFSSLERLIVGLVVITCRARKISTDAATFNAVKRQVWDKILRTSQKYYPPVNVKQLVPEFSRTGVLVTKNRLSAYGLVRYHKAGQLGIISHLDTGLCQLLLMRSHAAVGSNSSIHCAGNLTNIRLRTGYFAVAMTRAGQTIKRFIQRCISCIKTRAEVQPYRMGAKAWVEDEKFGMGIFSHINVDIVGHFLYYPLGRSTRRNSAHKVWVVAIVCLYTKALNMVLMKNYSSEAFKMLMSSHFCRYGAPAVLTADNGSQIRKSAGDGETIETGHSSGALTSEDTSVGRAEPGIFDWCRGAKGWLRNVLVYLAPTEAQHRSGTIEAHIRQIKQMLRSSCRRIRKQPIHPFVSIFDLDLLLVKISGLLNSRPIFSSDTRILTISDVLQPKISTGDQFEVTESDIFNKDEIFKATWEIFSEEMINGELTKPGKKSHTQDPTIQEGTVVLVLYPSRNRWRYGRVNRMVTKYKYEILMKHGQTYKGVQVIDRCNIVSLFNPKQHDNKLV